MQSVTNDDHPTEKARTQFPALTALRLTEQDLTCLSRQGFVCEDKRKHKSYFKLRFRRNGKQVVRYVGTADRAVIVEQELWKLQHDENLMRDLKAKMKMATKILRKAKIQLMPLLEANGLAFHGLSIRQTRNSRTS